MAKFYVGQRVRLVRAFWQRNSGKTGVIRELWSFEMPSNEGNPLNCSVDWDDGTKSIGESEWGAIEGSATHTSRLEPLVPPHEACDDAEFIASLDELAQRVGEVA
jgi:hypothetical protein